MTPGALLLKTRTTFKHGVGVAFYRDMVRSRIVGCEPMRGLDDLSCEIHVLTSQRDYLNLLWALRSFYRASGRRYALCVHDDGSLSDDARATITRLFPDARQIEHRKARDEAEARLAPFPRCRDFRLTNHLSPKLFDFPFYARSERIFLLDSDVLFFRAPEVLLQRLEDANYGLNSVNADVSSAYTVDPEIVRERTGVELIERFNSGLGLIFRDSLKPEWIEEFLALPDVLSHGWRIEQTMYALCSSRWGVELLPDEYDVRLETGVTGLPSRHYVGAIRHLMYGEGMRDLVKSGFLKPQSA